jgi:eukaryotic-like serine/threonine-protein kinase
MGEVYLARDTKLNRDVAIKVLPAAFSENGERLRRFEQEAQATSALNHPNILIVYDVGSHERTPYVVSELLEGETLRQRLGGSAIAQRRAMDYALHIARGLAAAHEKGIVHRDLKPDNIFITKDGRVKILDFGVAKLTQLEVSESQTEIPTRRVNTDPGVVIGTVGYMSPEQVRGKDVDHRWTSFR